MIVEVLYQVCEGWKPLYLIDVKKFDKEDNTIPVDGYAEITHDYEVGYLGDMEIDSCFFHEFENRGTVNRDFIIRAKRLKGDEWKIMKYKMYKEVE